jgi:RHS repeat-associated protein
LVRRGRNDGEAGLSHVGARYYEPAVGRWTRADKWLGDLYRPLSLNRYLYCEHEPVNRVDPSGDDWFDDLTKFFVRVPVVQVVGAEQEPAHRDDLRRSLLRFLSRLGNDETVCEQLSLSDLPSQM